MQGLKVLLIGGTSHVGKSTTAARLAERLGWRSLSTDSLSRHPGRPWRADGTALPDDVVDHFSRLSTSQLVDSVRDHYRNNVWPIAAAIVRCHVNNPFDPSIIVEGSAVLPDPALAEPIPGSRAVWLTVAEDLLASRIRIDSGFDEATGRGRRLIDAFVARTLAFDRSLRADLRRHRMHCLDASRAGVVEALLGMVETPVEPVRSGSTRMDQ